MRKKNRLLIAAAAMVTTMTMDTSAAFAGEWLLDGSNWKYVNDNGVLSANCWQWIDGNHDGIAECYCFGENWVMYADTVTPDGYTVNASGAWTVNGEVQTKPAEAIQAQADTGGSGGPAYSGSTDIDTYAYAYEAFELVNREREARGLEPLEWAGDIAECASVRAMEAAAGLSHIRPDGRTFSSVFDDSGISYSSCGENVASGQMSPAVIINAWMNSEGHRRNILNASYEETGISCYSDGVTLT